MTRRDAFAGYHPCVNFIFYALVLVFSMCLMHPAYLAVSFFCAAGYCARAQGGAHVRRTLLYLLPMMLLAAVLNPVFNHEGVTILTYLPSGNPLTLESLYYGAAAAGMLGCVVLWFVSFHAVMTSDKFVYLFGRVRGHPQRGHGDELPPALQRRSVFLRLSGRTGLLHRGRLSCKLPHHARLL